MVRLLRFNQKQAAAFLKRAVRVLKTPDADILFAPADLALGRILIVTPRRVGNAPQRNKARRRLRAVFREKKIYEFGYDVGVIVKEGAELSVEQWYHLLEKAYVRYEKRVGKDAELVKQPAETTPETTDSSTNKTS